MEEANPKKLTPWRAAERAYYSHHFQCGLCKGAGQMPGVMDRCEEGAKLWQAYNAAPLPLVLDGPTRPAPQPFRPRR